LKLFVRRVGFGFALYSPPLFAGASLKPFGVAHSDQVAANSPPLFAGASLKRTGFIAP